MKQLILRSIVIIVGILLSISCSNNAPETLVMDLATVEDVELVDNISVEEQGKGKSKDLANFIPTQAASMVSDDGLHKFIRTARLKFKVKDTALSAYDIERIILRNSGFIIKSEILNVEYYTSTILVSEDSILITRKSTPQADMVLRVPVGTLDTTLRQIAPLATKIDFRMVEAEDVTAKLLSDRLAQERLAKKQQRLGNAIGSRSGRLGDAVSAEDALDEALQQADEVKVSTYNINDQINYSTIYITLYQESVVSTEKVVQEKEVVEYKPGLGIQMIEALESGWNALAVVFICLVNVWPLLILLLVAGMAYVRYRRSKK